MTSASYCAVGGGLGFVIGVEFNNWRRARVQDNATSWTSR
jgi:hypothetical protein